MKYFPLIFVIVLTVAACGAPRQNTADYQREQTYLSTLQIMRVCIDNGYVLRGGDGRFWYSYRQAPTLMASITPIAEGIKPSDVCK